MTITNDFVFIHFPINGGSFVTACLKELYDKTTNKSRKTAIGDNISFFFNRERSNYCNHYMSETLVYNGLKMRTQYQGCSEIPKKHRGKPIISSIRNPFDRYVSLYKYGFWKTKHNVKQEVIAEKFPQFPNLTFKEYMDFTFNYDLASLKKKMSIQMDIGSYTLHYLKMFSKNFLSIKSISTKVLDLSQVKFYDVKFLHMERISKDLFNFLAKMGWPEKRLQFVLEKELMDISRPSASYAEYYDRQLLDLVKQKESMLFDIFSDYSF